MGDEFQLQLPKKTLFRDLKSEFLYQRAGMILTFDLDDELDIRIVE